MIKLNPFSTNVLMLDFDPLAERDFWDAYEAHEQAESIPVQLENATEKIQALDAELISN